MYDMYQLPTIDISASEMTYSVSGGALNSTLLLLLLTWVSAGDDDLYDAG